MTVKTLADFGLTETVEQAEHAIRMAAKAAVERAEYAKLSAFPNVGAD